MMLGDIQLTARTKLAESVLLCREANNTDNNGALDINITFPEIDFSMVHFRKNWDIVENFATSFYRSVT